MTMNDNASESPSIVWLRDDLRLADNPALAAAVERGRPFIVLYLLDELSPGIRPLGGASRWWLHHSLEALDRSLRRMGQSLTLRRGPAADVVADLAREIGAGALYWNRRYGEGERAVDAEIKAALRGEGVAVESFQANLLFEPWTVRTQGDQPFRVFSAFWRACHGKGSPRAPLASPSALPPPVPNVDSEALADWELLPNHPDWAGGLRENWTPGEAGGRERLDAFITGRLTLYADHRDEPAVEATSRLSPHLRFGETSPFQVWHAAEAARSSTDPRIASRNIDKFLSEVGWREFCWHLLFHKGDLATANFQPRFDAFPWPEPDPAFLQAWRTGRTGFPIVDAGMRQLWQTGWMHNRVRMIVASFLVKNMLVDWRVGEAWFWDTLVDADAANNPAGWQWVAGSGADAAPYFRVFNPILQSEKFDPDGHYIRHFIPELAGVAPDRLHGRDPGSAAPGYPAPILDLRQTRERALRAFDTVKNTE